MNCRWLAGFGILILMILLSITSNPVLGQQETETPTPEPTFTPEPTITATSPVIAEVTLTSGHTFMVERSVTYGDAAIVIAVAVLWITTLLGMATQIARGFMNR